MRWDRGPRVRICFKAARVEFETCAWGLVSRPRDVSWDLRVRIRSRVARVNLKPRTDQIEGRASELEAHALSEIKTRVKGIVRDFLWSPHGVLKSEWRGIRARSPRCQWSPRNGQKCNSVRVRDKWISIDRRPARANRRWIAKPQNWRSTVGINNRRQQQSTMRINQSF